MGSIKKLCQCRGRSDTCVLMDIPIVFHERHIQIRALTMLPTAKPSTISPQPNRPLGGYIGAASLSPASSVPSLDAETDYSPPPVFGINDVMSYDINHPRMQIYHPDLAPSAQSTEAVLMSRSLLQQSYAQDAAATRIAQISNAFKDAPRFSHSLNIMA